MKTIYLNTGNLAAIEFLREDPSFEPVYEYKSELTGNLRNNEYGRIKTHTLFLSIILGYERKNECPWCNGEMIYTKIDIPKEFNLIGAYMECVNCGARGPIHVCDSLNYKKNIELYVKERYSFRINWDDSLLKEKGLI